MKKIRVFLIGLLAVAMLVHVPEIGVKAGTGDIEYTDVTFGKSYYYEEKSTDFQKETYYKLNVAEQGLIHISATKLGGAYKTDRLMDFALYDSSLNKIWEEKTLKASTESSLPYDLFVGVKKGTYYVGVSGGSKYYGGSTIVFSFTGNNQLEIEPNDSKETATPMKFNTEYKGYFGGDGAFDNDYWKINLEKGKDYELRIKDFYYVKNAQGQIFMTTPSGKNYLMKNAMDSHGSVKINAEETGTYYFYFDLCIGKQQDYTISLTEYSYSFSFKNDTIYTYLGDIFDLDYNLKCVGYDEINYGYKIYNPSGVIVDADTNYTRPSWTDMHYIHVYVKRDWSVGDYRVEAYHSPGDLDYNTANKSYMTMKVYATKEEALAAEQNANNAGKYSNEWINGKWYNADGTQTYKGTMSWKSNATGWWIEDTDGWYPTNQWQKIDGTWYFFKPDGYMAASEYYNGYWFNADGSWDEQYFLTWKCNSTGWWVEDISGWWPSSSWLKIDGYWYYFDASGYMVSNCYIDGWWISADGVCY